MKVHNFFSRSDDRKEAEWKIKKFLNRSLALHQSTVQCGFYKHTDIVVRSALHRLP